MPNFNEFLQPQDNNRVICFPKDYYWKRMFQYIVSTHSKNANLFLFSIGGLFLASGSGGSITGIIMCCFFLAAGIFFVGVGLCYPGMAVKELDSAKLKANLIDASFNEGKN